MATELTPGFLAPAEYAEWDALVTASPHGSVYALSHYLAALCEAGGGRFRIAAVRRGSVLAGGVPLYERSSAFGSYVAPRLLLYYTSPVLANQTTKYPSERTARQLKVLAALADLVGAQGFGRVSLRCRPAVSDVRPFLRAGWTATPGYTYVVKYQDAAAAWQRVEQNLRRLIERCAAAGVTLAEDEDFETFYRLHTATMTRKDLGVYLARDAFEAFFKRLRKQDLCRLFHARAADGTTLASQLVLLGPKPVSHTVAAGASPEAMKLGASAFLRWQSGARLAGLGWVENDLTDASLDAVAHFKSQLGGDLETCLVLESPGTVRYRWGASATRLYWRTRSAIGSMLRRGGA